MGTFSITAYVILTTPVTARVCIGLMMTGVLFVAKTSFIRLQANADNVLFYAGGTLSVATIEYLKGLEVFILHFTKYLARIPNYSDKT